MREKTLSLNLDDGVVLCTSGQILRLGAATRELDLQAQIIHGISVAQCIFVGDEVALVGIKQRLIEGLHTQVATRLDDLFDFGNFTLEDQVAGQRRIQQDLHRSVSTLTALLRNEALRHHGFEIQRQVHKQLSASLLGEKIDDAIQRLVGAVGMQSGHAQV